MTMASNQLTAVRGGEEYDIGEDRISQLPDEIIHTIFRSLESHRAAARTSVMSRRWLQLWRSYPFFEFEPSYPGMSILFRGFVDSSSRKLLPPHTDSDYINCASVEAIRNVWIALQDDYDFRKEDLDRLLLLLIGNANGLSPEKFALAIWGSIDASYSLEVIPNWSRTKSVTLYGCDLAFPTTPILGTHDSGVVSLSSLEFLELETVSIGEELLHSFLINAPRLVSLILIKIYGIDRLEVVSSPCLEILYLDHIYRVERKPRLVRRRDYCYETMRTLRILSPKLESLSMWLKELDELVIDAPNMLSLAWNVRCGDEPIAKFKIVSLASTCQSTINLFPWGSHFSKPTWLRLFLSTLLTQFHNLNLVVESKFPSLHQQLSEYTFPPPKIDKLQFKKQLWKIRHISEAAALIDGLFWACHPKFVSITQNKENGMIAEYMCRMYLKSDDTSNGMNAAATSSSWSLHLQDMKVENEINGKMMEISKGVIRYLTKQKEVRFMLIWD